MPDAPPAFSITPAEPGDVPLVLTLIRELAEYERLAHEVVATERDLHAALFGPEAVARAIVARDQHGEAAGFALYFFNFSTFVGRPGLYLEDLFVRPRFRRMGLGRRLLSHLASIAVARGCGRMEWSVLDWNTQAIAVYRAIGAQPMDEWTVQRLSGEPLRRLASATQPAI